MSKVATKKPFIWTPKRKEVADLAAQGKEFMEIIANGYGRDMTSKVLTALKRGEKPPELAGNEQNADTGKPLVAVSSPKTAPIIFRFAQKEIILDPLELHNQYRYYLDLSKRNGGIVESFSEVLTLGIQVLWVLHQDIPMNPITLKAIFTGAK